MVSPISARTPEPTATTRWSGTPGLHTTAAATASDGGAAGAHRTGVERPRRQGRADTAGQRLLVRLRRTGHPRLINGLLRQRAYTNRRHKCISIGRRITPAALLRLRRGVLSPTGAAGTSTSGSRAASKSLGWWLARQTAKTSCSAVCRPWAPLQPHEARPQAHAPPRRAPHQPSVQVGMLHGAFCRRAPVKERRGEGGQGQGAQHHRSLLRKVVETVGAVALASSRVTAAMA